MAANYTRRITLYINDKEVENNIASIQKAYFKANAEMKKMELGSKEYVTQMAKVKDLKGILDEHNQALKKAGQSTGFFGNLKDKLTSIPGPAGAAVNGLMGMGKAMWALVANPIGATIAAIVAGFMLLYKAFTSTDSGANQLAGVFKGLSNVMDIVLDRAFSYLKLLGSIATFDFKGIKQNAQDAFGGLGKAVKDAATAGYDYVQSMDEINDREAASVNRTVKLRNEIEALRNSVFEGNKTTKEKADILQMAMDKEIELNQIETGFLAEKNQAETKNLASKIQNSKLTMEQKESQLKQWLSVDDKELESLAEKDAAFADFVNKNEDAFQALQKSKSEELAKEGELATGTRKLQKQLASEKRALLDEDRQATEAEKKKAIEALETGFEKEKLSLKQQYAGKEELDKEFKARTLANELAYINMKLALTTDNKEQLVIKQQIIDKENEYKSAIEAAVIPMMKKKEATTNLNKTTLETNKLTGINTTKTNEATDAVEKLAKKQQAAANIITGASSIIADGIYDMASGTEGATKKMGKTLLKFAIDLLKKQALIAVASSTVQSLAQADSVATFGISGGIRAAVLAGLIEVAAAGLNGLVDSLEVGGFTTHAASDSTPVGVVHANEWVASSQLLRNPETRSHIDYLENVQRGLTPRFDTTAISGAVRGFQSGGFGSSAISTNSQPPVTIIQQSDPALLAAIQRMNESTDNMNKSANHLASKPLNINTREIFKSEENYQNGIRSSEY